MKNTPSSIPQITMTKAERFGDSLRIYAVINFGFLMNDVRPVHHTNFSISIHNSTFKAIPISYITYFYRSSTLKFIIPFNQNQTSIDFKITDDNLGNIYSFENVRIQSNLRKGNGIAACAYISSYNSQEELFFWIAYYLSIRVNKIILYCTDSYHELRLLLWHEIIHERVELIDFGYHINNSIGLDQCYSNQHAQINSCYYSFRHHYQYLILCDLDEFIMSTTHPNNIFLAVDEIFKSNPGVDAITLDVTRMTSGKESNRSDILKEGNLFNEYIYPESQYKGRKMIVKTGGDFVVGIHDCKLCKMKDKHLSTAFFHYKRGQNKSNSKPNRIMTDFSNMVKTELKEIMRFNQNPIWKK